MNEPLPKEKKSKRRNYPDWVFASKRSFQRRKRADLRALKKAMEIAQNGCAYMPGYRKHWCQMHKHFSALFEAARPRNWK